MLARDLPRICPEVGLRSEIARNSLGKWPGPAMHGMEAKSPNWPEVARLRESFASQERVSGFPEKRADLRGSPGNFRGSPGNFRGSLGIFRGTPGLLLSSTVRELPGKSPKNFRGSLGNL